MKKLYILHENNEWLEPIREALIKQGIPFEEWFLAHEGLIDLSEEPPDALFFNRMSPSAHTRGHYRATEYTSAILTWLEHYKRRVVNGYSVWQMETNKILQYQALMAAGIEIPKTIAAFSPSDIRKAALRFDKPIILKHNRGGKGTGVRFFASLEQLELYLSGPQFLESPDGINLVQEYIESEEPSIFRLEFINKKFVYAVKIDTSRGFDLCPADACTLEGQFCPTTSHQSNKFTIVRDFAHPIIDRYIHFLEQKNIDVAGIECIRDKQNRLYTYDINTNTNYNRSAEIREGGVSAYEILAQFLGQHNQ